MWGFMQVLNKPLNALHYEAHFFRSMCTVKKRGREWLRCSGYSVCARITRQRERERERPRRQRYILPT